jgi:hydroxypyruvate reductase
MTMTATATETATVTTTFEDRERHARSPAHELALDCLEAGIEAARPERAVERHLSLSDGTLRVRDETYDLSDYDRVLVLGGGKAAGGLVRALEELLGDRIDGGAVVLDAPADSDRVALHVGGHPVPDEGSVAGARRVLELARGADERTLVLAAVTGGGSALLAAPTEGVSLADLRAVTESLLASGASIDEVNAVRKHCSAIKGGGLARAAGEATVVGLLVSDVVGDDPAVVASGPTAPDPSTFADARAVLDRYGVDAPASIRERIDRGVAGEIEETPGPDDPLFDGVSNHVLIGGHTAIEAARTVAAERGHATRLLSARLRGEATAAGLTHVAVAEEALDTGEPVEVLGVVLSGGETTVTLGEDPGEGGPNQELALRAAIELPEGAVLASVDTDGRDGATDAAGALVHASTVESGDADAARGALAAHDAGPFLEERGALLRSGRTGTNVNDLRVLVVFG